MQNEDIRRQQAMMQSDAAPMGFGSFAHVATKPTLVAHMGGRAAPRALPKAA